MLPNFADSMLNFIVGYKLVQDISQTTKTQQRKRRKPIGIYLLNNSSIDLQLLWENTLAVQL